MGNFTEQEDQWLRDALHGAAAPPDLRERIRSRLRQEAAVQLGHIVSPQPTAILDNRGQGPVADGLNSQLEVARPMPIDNQPSTGRRQWLGWALALSAAALVLVMFQWSRPYSLEQLAQHCLQQLDGVLDENTSWNTDFNSQLSELSALNDQLRGNVQPLGYQDQTGEPFAERCRVWKLHSNTTHKSFYVFDFQDARDVRKLTSQLQAINRVSGGWSMVAMRSADRVVVVLFEGAVDNYLYRLQSA